MASYERLKLDSELSDEVLEAEFNVLKDECYMDQAGAALYSRSQIDGIAKDLTSSLYSNPHSSSISSKYCTDIVDQVRYRILAHFNADVNEYSVIFTSGTTASLKLVAETFKFNEISRDSNSEPDNCGTFAYLQDNHTSVLGMREIVVNRGAKLQCIQHHNAFEIMNSEVGDLKTSSFDMKLPLINSLFVFPAQCNFSGLKYPLNWIEGCHQGLLSRRKRCGDNCFEKWYCLLDAASLVSCCPLDLSVSKPDFVCLSFYKIFGFPTGLGALIVRNSSADVLEKSYYGGGTVMIALSSETFHVKRPLIHERFEDGTLNFLSIISLLHGLEALRRLSPSMEAVLIHCYSVAQYCYEKLSQLHHANGTPAVILYHDTDFSDPNLQGNIVNFNVVRHNGDFVGYAEVQALSNLHKIHLRTGCFCNPGACQRHLKLTNDQLRLHFQEGHVCGDDVDLVNGQPTGSVRVSFGIYSRLQDVDKLISLIENCFILKPVLYKVRESSTELYIRNYIKESNSKSYYHEKVRNVPHQSNSCKDQKPINHNNNCGLDDSVVCENSVNIEVLPEIKSCSEIKLEKMFIYPVKSCGAMAINDSKGWPIDSRGFKYDRQWMVVTSAGVALTQKIEPLLCCINPRISIPSNELILSFLGKPDCVVPIFNNTASVVENISMCMSKVCGDSVSVSDCGNHVADWLADVLKRSNIRLVRQCSDDNRITRDSHNSGRKGSRKSELVPNTKDKNKENNKSDSLNLLSFSNQAQFLLINMSTVNWLAEQLPLNADCDKEKLLYRFRSNFVVSGRSLEPFAEKNWTKLEINGTLFKVIGPCSRCQMICIDQFTGERTKEPLTTLASSLRGKLHFGVYLQLMNNAENFKEVISANGSFSHCENILKIGDSIKYYT